MQKDVLHLLRVYCQVVESGNFTLAAEVLDVQTPAVSKAIAKLESLTGCKLLNRSTRGIETTDAGELLYRQGAEKLLAFDALIDEVSSSRSVLQGVIKLTATPTIGEELIAPVIPLFRHRYPQLNIELLLSNDILTMPSQNIDIALRSSEQLEDSSLISIKLFDLERVVVATPDYLSNCGPVTRAEDLTQLDCLGFKHRKPLLTWPYVTEQQQGQISLQPGIFCNSYRALSNMCLQGAGIARLFRYQIAEKLQRGELKTVLDEMDWGAQSLHAVYHQRLSDSPKLKVFLDFLVEQTSQKSGVRPWLLS